MRITRFTAFITTADGRAPLRRVSRRRRLVVLLAIAFAAITGAGVFAADTNAPSSVPARPEETNSQELRAYLQLQEQIHSTQITIERNRREAEESATQSLK